MVRNTPLFDAFNDLNVLIVGDVMIDRYLTGSVNRISPEAPVPVVHLQQDDNRLGGAANVALNIKALGANPFLCSVIGDEDNANVLIDLLPKFNLPSEGIIRSVNRTTTVKTRIIAGGQQLLRLDREITTDLSEADGTRLLNTIRHILNQHDVHVIILQDYNKGTLTPSVIQEIIQEAHQRNIPTSVDPKNKNFWAYRNVTLFKPNLKEIGAQLQDVKPTLHSLNQAAKQINARLGNTFTLITLSEKGLYFQGNGLSEIVPTQPRSIADVCGAGDTVISIASLGLALRMDIREVAVLANLAGGQVCERLGVVPIDKKQLEREYAMLEWVGQEARR